MTKKIKCLFKNKMPKFYKRKFRPRRYKKRSYGLSSMSLGSAWKTAKYAAQQVWKLKGLVNSEMMKLDTTGSAVTVTNTGIVTHMTAVPQGDTDASRHGNSIYCRSLNIKGYVRMNASATASIYRLSVIIDTQQVGDTAPSFSDIYESADVNAHLNNTTVGRYKVLKNIVFTLVQGQTDVRYFNINIPMRHHVRYNGTASSDVQKGGIYLVRVSNEGAGFQPADSFEARLSYHDN